MNQRPPLMQDSDGGAVSGGGLVHPSGVVANLTSSDLPLEAGLLALSEEAPSYRLRRLLRSLARDLSRGAAIEEVLSRSGYGMQNYLRGLVRAGVQSGQLGEYLEQFLRNLRNRRAAAISFWGMVSYPLLLTPLAALIGIGLLGWIVPQFKSIFDDFGIELPAVSILLLNLTSTPVVIGICVAIPILVILGAMVILLGRFIPGHAARLRLFQRIPVVGTPSRMRGLSEFCSLLGLLVSGRVPLPEALRMTASAVHDANLRQGARRLASRIEHGDSLEMAACGLPQISSELQHLFRWESRGDAFGDILMRAGEIYSSRTRVQAGLAMMIFQPIVFMCVAIFLGLVVLALFMPLFSLLNALA